MKFFLIVVAVFLHCSWIQSTSGAVTGDDGDDKCWSEIRDEWQGEITVPATCPTFRTTVPIPPIFNLTTRGDLNFTVYILNFTDVQTFGDCNGTGKIVIEKPSPGLPIPYMFCQGRNPDSSLQKVPFMVRMDKGIPGEIVINYTAPADLSERLSQFQILFNFTDYPCGECGEGQTCVNTTCITNDVTTCESPNEAFECVYTDVCRRTDYTCENGGTCQTGSDGNPTCSCPNNTLGDHCEHFNDGTYCLPGTDSYPGSNIYWHQTKMNSLDTQPCPLANGVAKRRCLIDRSTDLPMAVWAQPDLSECVSPAFSNLYKATATLQEVKKVKPEDIVNITSVLRDTIRDYAGSRLYAGDLSVATDTVKNVAGLVRKVEGDTKELTDVAQSFGSAVGNIIDPATAAVWRFSKMGYLEDQVSTILGSIEEICAHIGDKQASDRYRRDTDIVGTAQQLQVNADNVEFSVHTLGRTFNFSEFTFTDASIQLPVDVFNKAVDNTVDSYINVYQARYSSLAELLRQTNTKIQNKNGSAITAHVNSDVVSSKVLNVPEHVFRDLRESVRLQFHIQNQHESPLLRQKCVFLNMSAMGVEDRWLDSGCVRSPDESNETMTVCYCSHLTNFAVLMDVYSIEEDIDDFNSKILTYLSYGGGTLSIVGCLVSVITFEFFRLKNQRVRIHEQLALAIILVQLFFLIGIDRTENRSACKAIAICLHYVLVSMFCWMLVEGANLYLVLVKVFKSSSHMKKFLVIGWGIPLLVVAISAGIFHDQYGTGSICWITREVLLVAFVPAVTFVIVINSTVLVIIMRIMFRSMSKGSKITVDDRSSVKTGLWASAVLLPLLGLTWTFGFLSVTSNETLVFTYLFTLFNSFQGVFFFVFHCLFSVDVRNAYERRSRKRSQMRFSESSSSRRATIKRESDYDSTMYSRASTKTALTEAQSMRSTRSNKGESYYNEAIPAYNDTPKWQEDSFYEIAARQPVRSGSVGSGMTGRSTTGTRHSVRLSTRSRSQDGIRDDGVRDGDGRDADVRRSRHGSEYYEDKRVLNNSGSSEYVLYYGKNSPRTSDLLNYNSFDKNDLYAKVIK